MADTCQMVHPHHPDCRCPTCEASQDEICGKPAVGTHSHDVRVCEPCGRGLEREGFVIKWDSRHIGGTWSPAQHAAKGDEE